MPTPYDLYIRFLVTKGVLETDGINENLSLLGLPVIDDKVFEAQELVVSQTLPRPIWEQVEAKKPLTGDFLHYMRVLEVEDLWYLERPYRDKEPTRRSVAKLSYDVHQDPALRLTINSLLMKGMPAPELAQVVNNRFASMLREEHVGVYEKYFFSPRRMTRGAWRTFLKGCDAAEAKIYFTALSEPLDVLKTELELPSKISSSETLQYLLTKSYLKARQFLNINTPEANKEARYWIDTVLSLVDKYEKYRSSDAADFGNALQMEFDFVDSEFDVPDKEVLMEISTKLRKDEADKLSKEEAAKDEKGLPPKNEAGEPKK